MVLPPFSPCPAYPMIKTQDLTKVYGDLHAINNLTLELERGRPVRLHRPERLGQDHDDADPGHALAAHLGRGVRLRLLDLHASRRKSAG